MGRPARVRGARTYHQKGRTLYASSFARSHHHFHLCYPSLLHAQTFNLEVPKHGGQESGLGDVHGWICFGTNLTYTLNNSAHIALAYGLPRNDTLGPCGDADNGFIAQQNWNFLPPGQYTIRVFNNGVQFTQATFTVVSLGTEFLSGAAASCNTNLAGQNIILSWVEAKQNFVISHVGAVTYPSVAGTYQTSPDFLVEDCNFLTVPPDLPLQVGGTLNVAQNGGNLTVQSGTQTLTGDLEPDGDVAVVGQPSVSVVGSCTYALTAAYAGNFLDGDIILLIAATKVSGSCIGVSLPCGVLYLGSVVNVLAQTDGTDPGVGALIEQIHQAVQQQ